LMMNAQTRPDGYIKVELLDLAGRPVKSYEAIHCSEFKGDSLKTLIAWKGKNTVPSAEEGIKVKFLMKNATIYSFWIDR